jgi:hypothetical protein
MGYRVVDPFTPATQTIDLSQVVLSEVPQFVSFNMWVSTAGGGLAGGCDLSLSWLDIDGETRTLGASSVSLQDGTAELRSPVALMLRQSNTSQFALDMTLFGLADSALVRYAVLISSGSGSEVGLIPDP